MVNNFQRTPIVNKILVPTIHCKLFTASIQAIEPLVILGYSFSSQARLCFTRARFYQRVIDF